MLNIEDIDITPNSPYIENMNGNEKLEVEHISSRGQHHLYSIEEKKLKWPRSKSSQVIKPYFNI